MKYQLLSVLPVFLLLCSCIEESNNDASLLIESIDQVELIVKDTILIESKLIKDVSYEVKFYSKGRVLDIDQLLSYDLYLNGVEVDKFQIDLSESSKNELYVSFPKAEGLKSNAVNIVVLKLQEAIRGLNLSYLKNPDRLIKYEESDVFSELFLVEAILIDNSRIDITNNNEFYDFYVNNTKTSDFNYTYMPDGDVEFFVKSGGIKSNLRKVFIVDPFKFIKSIELYFSDSTNNIYAVQNLALYDFDFKIIGNDGEGFPVKAELFINEIPQNQFREVLITESGELSVYVESYGKKSNLLKIISRKDKDYPVVRMPIIFHVLESSSEIGVDQVKTKIQHLNDAFSNKFSSIGLYKEYEVKRSPSSVPVNIEFYLAETGPNGQSLTEPGIHRISKRNKVSWPITLEENKFYFEELWDPAKYINVFVSEINGAAAGFANFPPLTGGSLVGLPTYSEGYQLNYPYMMVIGEDGIKHPWDVYLFAHEMGHFLGLFHSENRNNPVCNPNIDYCLDTQDPIFGSEPSSAFALDCSGKKVLPVDFLFLGGMRNSFTFDQRERMRKVLELNPFLPLNLVNSRKDSFIKGQLDHSILPIMCIRINARTFGYGKIVDTRIDHFINP
ncbi:hypothetical protein Aoki45_12320 [Algoriphagus sp. oki45]|uniref:M43 family zinc metalloprotease n=1 Tax=Algoriphagus sp. oki45 TaxID=3067294 RepID=UPI0027F049BE|nr:hypothetical protein Aoki45_12320 [Algoriphagus sp. oki45]